MKSWIDDELRGSGFSDPRLEKRFQKLVGQLSDRMGQSVPLACQDWSNTKAAYRFLANKRVNEAEILQGHWQATRSRFAATTGPVLVLHDTTEFSYHRDDMSAIGITHKSFTGKKKDGRAKLHTVCGIMLHSSLVVTPEGVPLGLGAVKFWTRKKFKGANQLNRKIDTTRIPNEKKESVCWIDNLKQSTTLLNAPPRCVHVGDRGSDIYELFCAAAETNTHFLVRTCVDRLAGDGSYTIADEMREARVKGLHRIEVRDKKGHSTEAILELKYRKIRVLPPIGKQRRYPELLLTVIFAQERGTPRGRDRIDWKLITDMPVNSRREAVEKLAWYALRWKIETFHKILKSGCKAEELKLRTAQRLANALAVFCILSWRVFWMSMTQRTSPNISATVAFTATEIQLLDHLVATGKPPCATNISDYLLKLARLGGYLARAGDSPPGNMVIWRGLTRLTDLELGFTLGAKLVGN